MRTGKSRTLRWLNVCLVCGLASGSPVWGQGFREDRSQSEPGLTTEFGSPVFTGPTQLPQGVALESTIDPASYYVGPSDLISVNIWTTPPLSFTLSVTPEGTLIVPTVGEMMVADRTLLEAKALVRKMILARYRSDVEPSVTLLQPRPVVVTVTGNVLNPGSIVLAAHYRVDKAIEQANTIRSSQTPNDLTRVLSTISMRNITIRRKDGTLSNVDIVKFNATKEDRWNPYLREGDIVVVPRRDLLRNVIGVYGEVNAPGRYHGEPIPEWW